MVRRSRRHVLALCVFSLAAPSAAAQEYLREMPEPNRIIAAYDGADSLDRTARQVGALRVMRDLLRIMSYDRIARDRKAGRPFVMQTPDEARLWKAYAGAE